MTCEECRELLEDLVHDEIDVGTRTAVEAHLSGCAECARARRHLARFTTTVLEAVRPLRPAANFPDQVLARYEGTKAQLQTEAAAPARRARPVWPFVAGIAVLVAAGLALLLVPGEAEVLGELGRGREAARVLSYARDGAWRERRTQSRVGDGDRVEVLEPAGHVLLLDLRPRAAACLRAPCAVQLQRKADLLLLQLLPEAPGRTWVQTSGGAPLETRAVRVTFGKAWVEVACGEVNAVSLEPLPNGQLSASVQTGSARLGNVGPAQTVAEGFTRSVPQEGDCSPATQTKAGAFDWTEAR